MTPCCRPTVSSGTGRPRAGRARVAVLLLGASGCSATSRATSPRSSERVAAAIEIDGVSKGSGCTTRSSPASRNASSTAARSRSRTSGPSATSTCGSRRASRSACSDTTAQASPPCSKCIAGIMRPTDGGDPHRRALAALLELGAGFQPDLSGREEHLPQRLHPRHEAGRDRAPVRRHRRVRRGRGRPDDRQPGQVLLVGDVHPARVCGGINVDPEILLVDEVLAVGDESFQRKCLDKVSQFQREGRTIVVVTHSPDMVRQICTGPPPSTTGRWSRWGSPNEVIRTFRERTHDRHVLGGRLDDPIWSRGELSPLWHQVRMTEVEVVYPLEPAEAPARRSSRWRSGSRTRPGPRGSRHRRRYRRLQLESGW